MNPSAQTQGPEKNTARTLGCILSSFISKCNKFLRPYHTCIWISKIAISMKGEEVPGRSAQKP